MQKIVITGCGGMLGEAVYNYFKGKFEVYATDIDLNEPWLAYLDVRDSEKLSEFIYKIKPDYVFHLAALTDMEYCEKNPYEAYRTNSFGTENVAHICKKLDIPMIYVSTAGVFDGNQDFYSDYDTPAPLSIYGKSKYGGEKFVKEHLHKYFIFRPGWMIGGGPKKDRKFISKIIKQIKDGRKELFVVNDKFGSPTYTYDLAKIIEKVISTGKYGLYNSACEGNCSRIDIVNEILNLNNLNGKIKVNEVGSSYFKDDFFAPRPREETLSNMKLKMLGINVARHWKECLKEYMNMHDWGIKA